MSKNYAVPVEKPHSITYVARSIPEATVEQRERALAATHYNEFAFPAGMLTVHRHDRHAVVRTLFG